MRRTQLKETPWCEAPGCTNLASDVDHIIGLREGVDPYDLANLQSLCRKHHSEKTAKEVWGRK